MEIIIKQKAKNIKLNTDKLDKIGYGYESEVYGYNDIAIKVHRDERSRKDGLSYKMVQNLKKIDTKRILMPIEPVYYKSNIFKLYKGYTTKLVSNVKEKEEIINIDSNKLYNELQTLKNDINILSENKIRIDDIYYRGNTVFNGNIYYVDPGSYYIDKSLNFDQLYNKNLKELNFSLYYYLFCLYNNLDYIKYELKNMENTNVVDISSEFIKKISRIYEMNFKKDYSSDYMRYINNIIKILEEYGSIKNYKYHILKNYIYNSNNNSDNIKELKKIIK